MELNRYKEKNHKKLGIILFTLVCVFLVVGVILYQTYAIYEVIKDKDLLNGEVDDPGDIYFAFYVDGNLQKEMPQEGSGYILDEEESFCEIIGKTDSKIKPTLDPVDWSIKIKGLSTSRTKCNLYFKKGVYILGKEIPLQQSGSGLYEVPHENIEGTLNDSGFAKTEYRYAGSEPNNFVLFNNELWRIIGLVNVMTNENTVEQRVKIIKAQELGSFAWNNKGTNDWTTATLKDLLNGIYYNAQNGPCSTSTGTCDFTGNGTYPKGLDSIARDMIDEVYWNISGNQNHHLATNYLTRHWYVKERGSNPAANSQALWKGKIALMYPSDYGYAASGMNGVTRDDCLNNAISGYFWEQMKECNDSNWTNQANPGIAMGITPILNTTNEEYTLSSKGDWGGASLVTNEYSAIPTLYLKKNVVIVGENSGTNQSPYHLQSKYY